MKDKPAEIKLIISDIDGTLFSHKTNRVPQSSIDIIAKLQKQGIKVLLASGRSAYLIRKTGILDFFTPDGLITMN